MAERVRKLQSHLEGFPAIQWSALGSVSSNPTAAVGSLTRDPEEMRKMLAEYDENGFFVVKGLFKPEELEMYVQRFRDFCEGNVNKPDNMLVMKDVALAKAGGEIRSEADCTKVQDFQEDDVLFSFCKHAKVVEYVEAFIGENVRSIHSMLINKPPDLGKGTSRHPMHQDLYYFPLRPANRIVASWVAIDKVTRENGCLSVIPGSHKGKLREHGYPEWSANFLYHGIVDGNLDLDKRVFLEMDQGDCVFFHPLLIHGSGRNSTKGFRKAISCHYANGAECEFYPVPRSLRDEAFSRYTKGMELSEDDQKEIYKTLYIMKSRQISGSTHQRWKFS